MKKTLTHRTQTGNIATRTTAADYQFVTVATYLEDRYDGSVLAGEQVVLSWHSKPPKSYSADMHRVWGDLHVEAINGGVI